MNPAVKTGKCGTVRILAERDFASFVHSVGDSAAWLCCMLRCNPRRVLLVPHPAAELPCVAGEEDPLSL